MQAAPAATTTTTSSSGTAGGGGSRRDTWCPTDARRAPLPLAAARSAADADDAANGAADADVDDDARMLQRVHDGDTIDLGVVMRSAQLEADRATAARAASTSSTTSTTSTSTTSTTRTREPDLQLWMLPQKVANEIVALRKELADATARLDDAANATHAAESKLAQVILPPALCRCCTSFEPVLATIDAETNSIAFANAGEGAGASRGRSTRGGTGGRTARRRRHARSARCCARRTRQGRRSCLVAPSLPVALR